MIKTTKKDLIDRIAADAGVQKGQAEAALDALARVTSRLLAEGTAVALPGLGILTPKERAARTGRNPATGEAVEIAAKTAVTFKPGTALTSFVNG